MNSTAKPLSSIDLLTCGELSFDQVMDIYRTAGQLKERPASFAQSLAGKSAVMLFEKPSLRTRVSFEVGIAKLGGHALFYDHAFERIGERESVHDYARNLERWADVLIARTYSHSVLEDLSRFACVPVINALSDDYHPCQALADLFTLGEKIGPLAGRSLAYIGDGNNVCNSLLLLGATLGLRLTVISPSGFSPPQVVQEQVERAASASGATLTITSDPAAVAGHDAVYTDAWTSMGHEHEAQMRRQTFASYQVNAELMARASSNGRAALFMHCLPAHRGEEVTDEVIDSAQSIVFDQAENRMHVQNALLVHLLAAGGPDVVTRSGAAAPSLAS